MPTLAISPCPNDTFAFYGLLHGKTGYQPELAVRYLDIEALNRLCLGGTIDFCKISFYAYILARESYTLLRSGSALGYGCGPLVVAKTPIPLGRLRKGRIAIPGRMTTAALLLKLWLGRDLELEEMSFERIMSAVAADEVDAGLIIHESRFTFAEHGLVQIVDLGEWWEAKTGNPIPLGGIVARRELDPGSVAAFQTALVSSIDYAWAHREETLPFMRRHAQEMAPSVMECHVNLYVNRFTRDLATEGEAAIEALVREARDRGLIPASA